MVARIGPRSPCIVGVGLAPTTFQRRDHLAVSSWAQRRISRRTAILRCAQDDTPASASFDAQLVFFEM